MLRSTTVPIARAWNTWSSRPAEMVFLPLGVRLTPVVYADSVRAANAFPAGDPGIRLGPHAIDGSLVELDLVHAKTRLRWRYRKPGPFELVGSWRAAELGEWGLRFWINLCLSTEEGHAVHFDPAQGAAWVKVGHRFLALAATSEPVSVTGHPSLEALTQEYETHGYFYLASRAESAPVLALRFNLEMTRDGRFAAAVADRQDIAVARARELLELEGDGDHPPAQTGSFAGALDAVRDVTAWNTVWDEVNNRPYTSISRNWNLSKFGGFGVWLNDQQYAGVLAGLLDPGLERDNIDAWLASATPQGNLACLLTANDAWVDRTQLPLGAFLLWLSYLRTGSRSLLELGYETLVRNHAWWWANRDPDGRGLVSFGTSDVGEGLYNGTSFGARNESSMDNSPIHDEASYDPQSRTLTTMDVGLNSLLTLDAEMLATMSRALGRTVAAAAYDEEAEGLKTRIREELWDESRGIFANRLRSGEFVRSVGPTSFYPLICGAPAPDQLARLLRHLDDPATFAGRFVLPGTARNDPAAADNSYWRGRIWPPLNYLVWHGLRRNGLNDRASELARASFALFRASWDDRRLSPENYNAETGEPLDQPDTERFYNWGALMALMGVASVIDVSPWTGWELVNTGEDVTLGPVQSPAGAAIVSVQGGTLRLLRGDHVLFATALRGRFSNLRFGPTEIAFSLPDDLGSGGDVLLPAVAADTVLGAWLDGADLLWSAHEAGLKLSFNPFQRGGKVRVLCSEPGGRA
jgi:putative isomerase